MFTYKEIEKDDLAALAAMYVETFNAPPWNDARSQETAEIRLRQMAEKKNCFETDKVLIFIKKQL